MLLKKRALSLRSHTWSPSFHFWPPKTIKAHSSNWELQLRRLCHLRRLLEKRSKSWSNPLKRPPQIHQLHMTLPLLDHLFTFCLYLLYSMFWCLIFWDWMYYWWCIIYRHHFCLNLAFFYFLYSITLMFSLKHVVSPIRLRLHVTQSSLFFYHFCHIEDNV